MKTNSLIILASLAVLATNASAAPSQSEATVVVLPTYVVQAPHYLPAEQKVNASLNELHLQALVPALTPIRLPLVQNTAVRPIFPKLAAQDVTALRVAKL